MGVMHWWAIGMGAAALSAPIAVHFLTKPKPLPFALATIRFLQEVIEQRKTRSRFRDWLILALRALCVLLLALGLARPILREQPVVATQGVRDVARVVVLDVSQSMSAGSGGVSAWSQARAAALQYLDVGSGTEANVLFVAAQPSGVFDALSHNLPALREAVKQAGPLDQRADPRSALELAGKMLNQTASGTRELVIISDFQRGNWGTLFLDAIGSDVQIQFHSVAQAETANIAITRVDFAEQPVVGKAAAAQVELANYSDRTAQVRCRLEFAGVARQLEAELAPQSTQTIASEPILFDRPGWEHGWAKLESNLDCQPADDERPVAVRVRAPLRVVLVTRQPPHEIPSSSFYLEQALKVALAGQRPALGVVDDHSEPLSIARIDPRKTLVRTWPDSDVFIFDHAGALDQELLQSVASQLRRGKGLLYVASELVDAVNLEKLAELLGSDFQPPVSLHPNDDVGGRRDLFVRRLQSRQAPFSILGSNDSSPLSAVRFQGGLNTRATSEGLRDQVLAELSDTSALLYMSAVGAGHIAVLNTDLGKTNWSVHPSFLPVVSELTQALFAGPGQAQAAHPGEPLVRMLPATVGATAELTGVTVEGTPPTDGDYGSWEWSSGQGCMVWNWPRPSGAGIYALQQANAAVWMAATSAPAIEADLKALDQTILTERMAADRTVGFRSSSEDTEGADDTWSWLIVACLLGLIAEIVALRFSRM